MVLCGANAYEKKYYFNPDFDNLPERVKNELQIMCVLFTEDVGGILTVEFDEDGNLKLMTAAAEGDAGYDDIGAGLKIREIRAEKQDLFESLETYYKVFAGEET